jgi:hypothetical protein
MPDLEGEADGKEDAGAEDTGKDALTGGTEEEAGATDDKASAAASDTAGTTAAAAGESDAPASQPSSKIEELS